MDKPDKNLLKIDRNNLEEVCETHPQLAFIWGEKFAQAKALLSEKEYALKLTYAQVEREARTNPTDFYIIKPTEDAFKSAVLCSREYQKAHAEMVEAMLIEGELFSFVMALNARKDLICDLVKLHGQQYWSKVNPAEAEEKPDEISRMRTMRSATEEKHKRKVQSSQSPIPQSE